MRYLRTVAVLACVFSCACIDVPEIQQVPETPDGGEPDAHGEDSGTPPDASTPDSGIPDLKVQLLGSRSITNGDVQFSVTVAGPTPDKVELLVDGEGVATLSPPYQMRFDTQILAEGLHAFMARVTLGTKAYLSEPRELVVDRTPPQWVSRVPSTGSRAVPMHQVVRAVFSEPLDSSTVGSSSVRLLSDSGVIAADVSLAPEGTSLMIQPTSGLPIGTSVTVVLEQSVTDLAGNPIQVPAQEWKWSVPAYLPLGEPQAANPGRDTQAQSVALQVDGSGRPVVAWIDGSASDKSYGVYVRRWSGSAWEQLGGVLDANPGDTFARWCSLQIGTDGQPVVAWSEDGGAGVVSVHVRRWNGAAWDVMGAPVVPVLSNGFIPGFGFRFRIGKSGHLVLALPEDNNSESQLSVWRWSGSGWGMLGGVQKAASSWFISSLELEVDGAGNPFVGWVEKELNGTGVALHMKQWSGGAWETADAVFGGFIGPLAFDASGHLVQGRAASDVAPAPNTIALRVQVLRRNGTSWEEVGQPFGGIYAGETNAVARRLLLDDAGQLVALVGEPEVKNGPESLSVWRGSGEGWAPVGGVLRSDPGVTPSLGAIALDASGEPVLARAEQSESEPGRRRVHVYTPNN